MTEPYLLLREGAPPQNTGLLASELGTDESQMTSFLASDDAARITGQTINVDGGMLMS
jgi:NAD(P)-dependent dehydrogenase (short-subunit alcohol dehydrogenase family)